MTEHIKTVILINNEIINLKKKCFEKGEYGKMLRSKIINKNKK